MSVKAYTVKQIADIIGSDSFLVNENHIIKDLLIDSRKVTLSEGALFFAIKGERHNGHHYVKEMYEKGIRNFVVSDLIDTDLYPQSNFIKTPDVLAALQALSAYHRHQFEIPVVGITGSNGKTIVKEWLYQLLKEDNNIVRSPKSYNSQVGVPLSVWQIKQENEIALFEAGISKPGEMELLEKIIAPTIGVFTNIGEAHAEDFYSLSEKVSEKLKLFQNAKQLIYCRDYLAIEQEIIKNQFADIKLFTWSKRSRANLQVGRIHKGNFETEIQAVFNNDFHTIIIPFIDEASIENAINCWCVMLTLGYDQEKIKQRMANLVPVAMRLELKEGINNCAIINDSYNSDLSSLNIALDFLNQQKQHDKKTLVISDILQSGKPEEDLYREVSEMINRKGITRLIGVGEAISRQSEVFDCQKLFFKNTEDLLKNLDTASFREETVLIKGARLFGFEKLSKLLQQKAHETVLEINLDALVANLNYFKSKINKKPGVKLMAMVKAFSYGSGSFEIASVLQFHRVDYLAVAYADEGVELRRAGISLPIMVMNPDEQSFDTMLQFSLEPEIYSLRVLNLLELALKRNSETLTKVVPIHLKFDTGMHRLGFESQDLNELVVRIKNNKLIKVQTIFSHLVASEALEHDDFTRHQIALFIEMSEFVASNFDYKIHKHILNSAGISRFPEAMFDMVRLGISLYGIGHDQMEQSQLKNVSTLKTIISQIKNIPQGETIGYGRRGKATREMQIATIPIGYADGLNRKLSNGIGKLLVKGKVVPIIGNVCMDMCMIDITDVEAKEGDEVIVFGEQLPITEIANDCQTIPYEILCNVSRRVKRVYFQE